MSRFEAGDSWVGGDRATEGARRGILEYGLDNDPALASAARGGQPDTPLLVDRLDDPGNAYYLVPWMTAEGVAFVVKVDASTGAMLSATTFSRPIRSPFLTPNEALDSVRRMLPHDALGRPRLVWRPCRESTNPSRPFYEIPLDEGVLYVDMDGSVIVELTPLGLGG